MFIYAFLGNVATNMLLLQFFLVLKCEVVEGVLPQDLMLHQVRSRNEVIEEYFALGYTATEILSLLWGVYGIRLSLRQLKRVLKSRGCKRRGAFTDIDTIVTAIEEELRGSGSLIGYRAMHQRLIKYRNLVVTRDIVRQVIKILDPEGVEARCQHQLRRREYKTKGPNYIWHIDGYDKLKPYGFCVHGAIDGYSRKILWLEVANSNNNPRFITKYYLDYARHVGGTARIIRADRGTENGSIEVIQHFFRRESNDEFGGDLSFMYGRSTSNQRIEAWWGVLRKQCTDWWMRYFKDLRDQGLFCDDDVIHRECLKFCYMSILRKELYKVAELWNSHRIRPSSNPESPSGRPDILYHVPQSSNTQDYLIPVSFDEIDVAEDECAEEPNLFGCSHVFKDLAEMIMEDEGLQAPNIVEKAQNLYSDIINHIVML